MPTGDDDMPDAPRDDYEAADAGMAGRASSAPGVGPAPEGSRLSSQGDVDFDATVKDLHGSVDAALVLKKALEADLSETQQKLAEERAVRAELEDRLRALEEAAALGDQLREDISFVEEEQNKTFRRLKQATSELEQAIKERDGHSKQKVLALARVKQLQDERYGLEAQIVNLKERLAEMVSVFSGKRLPSG